MKWLEILAVIFLEYLSKLDYIAYDTSGLMQILYY